LKYKTILVIQDVSWIGNLTLKLPRIKLLLFILGFFQVLWIWKTTYNYWY